ncbi:MAG TPA: phosphotransferase [Ktedonobacterales bacterium]|nr:phosphotransferase [Ktedonobacterales bacterium]
MRLSEEALLAALHAWPLREPRLVQRLPGGFTSDVWRVEAGGNAFAAKYTEQPQGAFEGGLAAAELAEHAGISSGAPLRTKEGALSLVVEGPDGQHHPLALLHFVPGAPVNRAEPGAASLYGHLLGWTHRLFLDNGLVEQIPADLYTFLHEDDAFVDAQPGLADLIQEAYEAARADAARRAVTYGVIWADRMEIVREQETGRVGIIDWGAIERGPLLFDVALTGLWLFPRGSRAYDTFLDAYIAAAPIARSELDGLRYYEALLWARQAKYFAYRVGAGVTLGNSDSRTNTERLAEARQALERVLTTM